MAPKSKDYIFVLIQVSLMGMYAGDLTQMSMRVPEWLRWTAWMMGCLGIVIVLLALISLRKGLSVFPTPTDTSELVVKGVYKFARHPIYTGIILGAAGYAIYSGSGYRLVLTALLLILFRFKAVYEEKLLERRFSAYNTYRRNTGMFMPWF